MSRFVDVGSSAISGLGDYSRGATTFFGNNAGNYTFTVPTGVTEIFVNVFGSGGRGSQQNSGTYFCTGGGGGGYAGASMNVTAGDTFTIVCGKGGTLLGGNTVTDGADTTFSNADGTLILTGGGGKGGMAGSTGSISEWTGGQGGVGTINAPALIVSAFTASGGRGGNIGISSTSSVYNMQTGGGASGSLSGDGGRGGDIFVEATSSQQWGGTGGGGWAGGNGGDILTGPGGNSSTYLSTGGGGFINSGGSIFSNKASDDIISSGGSPYQGGQAWEQSIIFNPYMQQTYTAAAGTGIPQLSQVTPSERSSWWSYMTGAALTGRTSSLGWTTNGDGCGGWGLSGTSGFVSMRTHMVPGFGGGMGGSAYYNAEGSMQQAWPQTGRGRMVGGGGGANQYMGAQSATTFTNALSKGGQHAANAAALGRVAHGGGSGGGRNTNQFQGGDGFVVICYK